MAGSGKRINYSLRPAKQIERKMLAETFRRLNAFAAIQHYRYIGFGSFYFADFVLFHKQLGIKRMYSLEGVKSDVPRCEFNKPYSCVEVMDGFSSELLPTFDWNIKSIVWLDYDDPFDASVLTDIEHFFSNACPGSLYVVTLNAEPDQLCGCDKRHPASEGDLARKTLDNLVNKLGADNVPHDLDGKPITDKDVMAWNKAELYRRIINNKIDEVLSIRNGVRPDQNRFHYKQLFNFNYRDGARMMTTGGLLYESGQEHIVAQCGFANLSFISSDATAYNIEIPLLTHREIRRLDKLLPSDDPPSLQSIGVPDKDAKMYWRTYQYFPTFTESEV